LADDTKLEIVKEAIENVPSPVVFDSAGKYGAGLALEKLGECLDILNIAPEDAEKALEFWAADPAKVFRILIRFVDY